PALSSELLAHHARSAYHQAVCAQAQPAHGDATGMGRSRSHSSDRGLSPGDADPAAEAGLVYTSDEEPGIRRVRKGKGFEYIESEGKRVRDPATLDRIRSLVIPPAWEHVWISTQIGRAHV